MALDSVPLGQESDTDITDVEGNTSPRWTRKWVAVLFSTCALAGAAGFFAATPVKGGIPDFTGVPVEFDYATGEITMLAGNCPKTCYGQTCDFWANKRYQCRELENLGGCNCQGCSKCHETKLNFIAHEACMPDKKCFACQGDCDEDKDCAAGLKCFQRNKFEAVPGCSNPNTAQGIDFCSVPPLQYKGGNYCKGQCEQCEGDCDKDSDCKGDLVCFQRDKFAPVPFCLSGGKGDANGIDYCTERTGGKEGESAKGGSGKGSTAGKWIAECAAAAARKNIKLDYGPWVMNPPQCTELAMECMMVYAKKKGCNIEHPKFSPAIEWSNHEVAPHDAQPGDIAQFYSWKEAMAMTGTQHTSVVRKWKSGKLHTYDQNPDPVHKMTWTPSQKIRGDLRVFRPHCKK